MYKCLVVGCGRIAGSLENVDSNQSQSVKSHCMSFTNHVNINIVGCVDIELKAAKNLAEKYNINFYTDNLDSALKLKPDFISVCTPDSTHFEVVFQILKSNFSPKIIFLEKPAMTSQEDFSQICKLAKEVGTKIIVNHSRRFDDNYKSLRDLIISKDLGDCIRIDCWYYNGWVHNGVHLVDTLQYLFNEGLTPLSFTECNHKPSDPSDLNVQGHFLVEDTNIDVFINCMNENNYQLFELDFKFTEGRIRVENFEERFIIEKVYTNEIGEKVLDFKIENTICPSNSEKNEPIVNATNIIVDILENDVEFDAYSITAAEKTMKTIWDIKEKHKNEFK